MNVPTDTPSQTMPPPQDAPDSLKHPAETASWSFRLPFKAVFKPTNVGILTILGIALALRLWGLPFGLPNLTRPDEQNISQFVALHILQSFFAGQPDLNPHFFEYPSLYIYLVTLLYGIYHLIGHLLGAFPTPSDFVYHYLDNFTPFHLISRTVTALMGTATVWAQYRLGKAVFGNHKAMGLITAALLAVTYLHVRDSHFGVTDVPVTLWVTLSLWCAVEATQRGSQRSFWASALFAGLAAGTKYPAGLVLLAPLCGWVMRTIATNQAHRQFCGVPLWSQTLFMRQTCLLVALTLGGFLLTSPYILLDWPQFMADFNRQRQHMIDGHFLDLGIGWVYHLTFTLRYGLGLPLLMAGLAGMVLAITHRARAFWPVLVFGLAYYWWVGSTKTVFVRYAIPLLPVWITCGTFAVQQGVAWLTQRFPQQLQPRHSLPLTLALICAISLPTCISSLRYDWLLAQDDTRTLARNWLIAHLRPQESVGIGLALAHIDLPYQYNKYFLAPVESQHHFGDLNRNFIPSDKIVISDQPTQRHEFNITTYTNLAKLQGLGMRYFAIGHSPLTLFNLPSFEQEPITQQYRPMIRLNATTAINQTGPTRFDYDQLDAYYVPYRNLWSVDRPGPDITIYAVPPPKSS